jgi:hypothetical protein
LTPNCASSSVATQSQFCALSKYANNNHGNVALRGRFAITSAGGVGRRMAHVSGFN